MKSKILFFLLQVLPLFFYVNTFANESVSNSKHIVVPQNNHVHQNIFYTNCNSVNDFLLELADDDIDESENEKNIFSKSNSTCNFLKYALVLSSSTWRNCYCKIVPHQNIPLFIFIKVIKR